MLKFETERAEKDSWKIYRSKRDFAKAEMTVALQNVLCHVMFKSLCSILAKFKIL